MSSLNPSRREGHPLKKGKRETIKFIVGSIIIPIICSGIIALFVSSYITEKTFQNEAKLLKEELKHDESIILPKRVEFLRNVLHSCDSEYKARSIVGSKNNVSEPTLLSAGKYIELKRNNTEVEIIEKDDEFESYVKKVRKADKLLMEALRFWTYGDYKLAEKKIKEVGNLDIPDCYYKRVSPKKLGRLYKRVEHKEVNYLLSILLGLGAILLIVSFLKKR